MPPENTNSQYNTITNCYKTTSWASTHAGPANWNLHLGSRFCANMFQKCRKLLLRELQFSKFSGGAYPRTPLETKLLNILYMYILCPCSANWAGPPQKILSCYGPVKPIEPDLISPKNFPSEKPCVNCGGRKLTANRKSQFEYLFANWVHHRAGNTCNKIRYITNLWQINGLSTHRVSWFRLFFRYSLAYKSACTAFSVSENFEGIICQGER